MLGPDVIVPHRLRLLDGESQEYAREPCAKLRERNAAVSFDELNASGTTLRDAGVVRCIDLFAALIAIFWEP